MSEKPVLTSAVSPPTTSPHVSAPSSTGAGGSRLLSTARSIGALSTGRPVASPPLAEAKGPEAGMRRDAIFRRTLLLADMAALVGALTLTAVLSSKSPRLAWAAVACLPILVLGAKIYGLYDRDEALMRKTTLDESPKLFHIATLCALVSWIVSGVIVPGALDRYGVLLLWLALTALLITTRATARAISRRVAPVERCLFIGDQDSAKTIRSKLTDRGGLRAKMVAHLDFDEAAPWSTDSFSANRLAEIRELAQTLDVHRAIVAPRTADGGDMVNLVRTLKAVGVRVSVLPRLLEVVGSSVEFDDLNGMTLMGVKRFDLTRSSAALKRVFDLICSTLGLIGLSPVLFVSALLIKLDSPGPVFFRQLRVGRQGEHFEIIKFRTMVQGAEAMKDSLRDRNEVEDGLFKIAEDPRVTQVGRFLRRSHLDELPQLFNILRGEMSLVGPRPLVIDEDQRVEGWHRRRLELTPGLTGHWQILGPMRVPLGEMVAIDYLYVANWSLWNDIKILLRTVPHVIARRGV